MSPPLPIELIERIIDVHHDDKPFLKECSLVSRTWVPRTRLHLFSKSSTMIQTRFYQTSYRSHDNEEDKRTPTDVFCEILDNPFCTITPYVRSMRIDAGNRSKQGNTYIGETGYPEWFPKLWNSLNSKKENDALNLTLLWMEVHPEALGQIPPGVLNTLTSLSMWVSPPISASELKGMHLLFAFLGHLESLEELRLAFTINHRIVEPSGSGERKPVRLNRLQRLHLRDNTSGNLVLPWFSIPGLVEIPNLRNVFLDLFGVRSILNKETVQSFLDGICRVGKVEDLIVYFHSTESNVQVLSELDLRDLSELKVLDIRTHIRESNQIVNSEDFAKVVQFVLTARVSELTVYLPRCQDSEPPMKKGIHWVQVPRRQGFFF
ncbi:hypothetical protein Moror_5158 [Moniliophthora roreri MCA 2997]|uniref:F-box domain-containing protein n=2 Tax=Moniliophthora roreri TaxID=221103 RepID=V2WR04_MONRO|nr:hypothetical protein Moror_5158 [Moniliophthora roreri MCA 2997]KAI3603497.1 hypothetical protein WG66_014258 [Moniliophthora roreri]